MIAHTSDTIVVKLFSRLILLLIFLPLIGLSAVPVAFVGHPASVEHLVVSLDGRYGLSVDSYDTLRLRDMRTAAIVASAAIAMPGGIKAVQFSPDSRRLIVADWKGTMKLLAVPTLDELATRGGLSDSHSFRFSSDGRSVAFRDSSSQRLRILDAFTLQDVRSFPAPTGRVAFFAPDGTIGLDAGSELVVYDSLRGIELKARRQSTPWGNKVYSADGGRVVFFDLGSKGLFFREGNNEPRRLHSYEKLKELRMTSNGRYGLVRAEGSDAIDFWDLQLGQRLRSFKGVEWPFLLSEDGSRILFDRGTEVALLDTATGEMIAGSDRYDSAITAMALSTDGRFLVAGMSTGHIDKWNMTSGIRERSLKAYSDRVEALTVAPGNSMVVSGGDDDDATVRLWDLRTDAVRIIGRQKGYIRTVAVSPDGQWLISGGGHDGLLRQEFPSGNRRLRFLRGEGVTGPVAIHPDSWFLVALEINQRDVRIWNLRTREKKKTLKTHHQQFVSAVAISPDGRHTITGGADGRIISWNLSSGEPYFVFETGYDDVDSLAISPDSRYLLVGVDNFSRDNDILLFDIEKRVILRTLKGHSGEVRSVAFMPDGAFAASASRDRSIRFWDLNTGRQRLSMHSYANGEWIAITPEGYYNGSANAEALLGDDQNRPLPAGADYRRFFRPDLVERSLRR